MSQEIPLDKYPTWRMQFPGNLRWSNAFQIQKGMAPYGAVALGEIDMIAQRLRARQNEPDRDQTWLEEWERMVQINQLGSGRIPSGAIVERGVDSPLGGDGTLMLELNTSDFGTAQLAMDAINRSFGPGTATALDARVIQVTAPSRPEERVGFMARLQNIDISPAQAVAKVVINARTGSVVMSQNVRLNDCAVAHGNLSVVINTEPVISQPNPLSGGATVAAQKSQIEISQSGGALQVVRGGASLADVIKGLNTLGANPQDLVSILQAMKAAGALRAELESI